MNKTFGWLLLFLVLGCKSSGSGAVSTSSLSVFGSSAFPESFAIASPTEVEASAFRTAQFTSESKTFNAKVKALRALLASGTSTEDCFVNLSISNPVNATCYGPTLNYLNFDGVTSVDGSLPGGDLGIWQATETSTGEACAAKQLNNRLSGAASYVDIGTMATAALYCVAEAEGEILPSEGNTLNLLAAAAGAIQIEGTDLTLTNASITRNTNDSEGNAVYVSNISGTIGDTTYSIRLIHSNTSEDKSTYLGKVSVAIYKDDTSKPLNCTSGSEDGYTDAISVAYEKSSSTNIAYELKSANFCGNDGDPYTASATNYTVDLSQIFPTNPKGWANNANYLLASYNPSTGSGQFAYAWQAGMGDGYSRVFNVKITALAASSTANAYFGFGPDLATQTNMGTINGMICNWAGPAPNKVLDTNFVQKQTMLSSSGEIFEAVTSSITYDPVDDCESNASTFNLSGNSGVAFNYNADTTTKDLAAFSDITTGFGSLPSVPTEIDPVCLFGCR